MKTLLILSLLLNGGAMSTMQSLGYGAMIFRQQQNQQQMEQQRQEVLRRQSPTGQFWWWSPEIATFCANRATFPLPQPSVMVFTTDPKNISKNRIEPIREGSPIYHCDLDPCSGAPLFCAKVDR